VRKADNLPPSCAVVTKSGSLNFMEPSGPFLASNGTDLAFYSFGCKPDDGRIRPKHVVDIHPLINIIRKLVVLLTKYPYLFIYTHNGDGTFQN